MVVFDIQLPVLLIESIFVMNCKWYFVASSRKSESDIGYMHYSSGVKVCGFPQGRGSEGAKVRHVNHFPPDI